MRIIKHKSRRRLDPAPWYYVVEGAHAVATADQAAEIAIDVLCEEMARAPRSPTLWDVYGEGREVA